MDGRLSINEAIETKKKKKQNALADESKLPEAVASRTLGFKLQQDASWIGVCSLQGHMSGRDGEVRNL